MIQVRNILTAVVAVFALGTLAVSTAGAETVSSSTTITPRGTLSKTEKRPVDVHLEAKVMPDAGSPKIRELVNTRLNLPKDLTFSTRGTEVCRKDIGQNNPANANRPTAQVIADCPNSVVGGGTAVINVAGSTSPQATFTDPVLTVFNGGDDAQGNPILLIHGYSATVLPGGHGVPMRGALKDGVLDVSVPKLAANSAVSEFTFDLPGKVGKDPRYSLASCSTGKWVSNAVLTLGTPNAGTGQYDTEDFTTPQQTQDCVGVDTGGKAAITKPKVKGTKSVKRGRQVAYTVSVKNYGKRAAKGVKIVMRGKGVKAGTKKIRKIMPGRTARTKVRAKFVKKGKIKVKVTASAKGVKAKTTVMRVRVK